MRLSRLVPYALAFFSSLCIMVLELVASRLVAQHVGASLIVWTSVIGIILAGICLGNVLGGRLADRVEPKLALGTLYAIGAALTLACLWINAFVGYLPLLDSMAWNVRTLIVVSLNFLVPATVLGMISPVVAKMAVEQAKRTGSAIGDVYFWGAVGSITGTFLAGFCLIYIAPTSTIVAVVAASLALLAVLLSGEILPRVFSLGAALLLIIGALPAMGAPFRFLNIPFLPFPLNPVSAVGHVAAVLAAITAWIPLGTILSIGPQFKALPRVDVVGLKTADPDEARVSLRDLAFLAFLASLGFMALEMVAGRLVTRHLGSSVFGWTSVIGVLLGGLSIGNWLGGKVANRITSEKQASTLFLAASALVLTIILMESPPEWLVRNPFQHFFGGEPADLMVPNGQVLRQALDSTGMPDWTKPWWFRVLFWTGVQFLPAAISMGTVSPVVAKLAVDRVRKTGRTGTAIGSVYAWGMVGSILGTFLTGFLLIDVLGTKGVIIVLATVMALAATALGSIWHAAWAGIPLGLCVIAFAPPLIPGGIKTLIPLPGKRALNVDSAGIREFLIKQGENWGLREPKGDGNDPQADIAYIDESNYYYIKVNNEVDNAGLRRTLVLDNLIHGYELLGQPNRLDYDYEHIYAYVTERVMKAKQAAAGDKGKVDLGALFLGGGSYTYPRYLQSVYPRVWCEIAEIDPAVTRANHMALGLPWPEPSFPVPRIDKQTGRDVVDVQRQTIELGPSGTSKSREDYVKALDRIAPAYTLDEKTGLATVTLDGETIELGKHGTEESQRAYIERVKAWFDGSKYRIRTTWGDARQYAVKHQDFKFDIVFGDAFNDFSVPWHLTTHEFNKLIYNMLTPEGVYMINIIDLYESDAHAAEAGPRVELERRIADALRGRWKGERSADRVAADAVVYLMTDPVTDEWKQQGVWASAVFDGREADISRDAIAAALRAQRTAAQTSGSAPDRDVPVPTIKDLEASLRAILANAHAREAITTLDKARAAAVRRLKDDDEGVRDVITSVLDNASTDAAAQSTIEKRSVAIQGAFDRMISLADSVAESSADGLTETILAKAKQLQVDVTTEKLAPDQSSPLLAFLGQVLQVANQAAAADQPLQAAAARLQAVETARRVAKELRATREHIAARLRTIDEQGAGDEALARDSAAVVRDFLADREAWIDTSADAIARARKVGGFLGSWVATARKTFPNIYVYGTHATIGSGQRETFVVVASKTPLDLKDLGTESDQRFETDGVATKPEMYNNAHMTALQLRSHKLILTDDHAPVENLLAPVAATRADD